MTIEMYPSDQVADLRAEVTHWYENLQKEQMNQQAQLQEFGQSGRQPGDFPGEVWQVVPISSLSQVLHLDHSKPEQMFLTGTQPLFTSTTSIEMISDRWSLKPLRTCIFCVISCRRFDGTSQNDLFRP